MLEREDFRAELHKAVDTVLDRFFGGWQSRMFIPGQTRPERPNRTGDWYEVIAPEGSLEMLVAETSRFAWHKERDRVVVFARWMGSNGQPYPWLEYCENDTDGYSADLRNPEKPGSVLRDGDPLPKGLTNANVRGLDELYEGVRNGPSLRLVVDKEDVERLIRYAYWTSRVVGRI